VLEPGDTLAQIIRRGKLELTSRVSDRHRLTSW
jgi:hypothetical protein